MLISLCDDYLEPLRHRFGMVTVISGYRTRAYNASVGGAPRSFHVYEAQRQGVAADVRAHRGDAGDWWRFLLTLKPGGLGRYSQHVHVDNRRGLARW